jgi:2-oxoisovalerate dehydrogenase E1 component alpha subunit
LFFCRNNGYAISTSIHEQYASDGIVCRAKGFGMAAIRVDGNDLFAVHEATKAAREYSVKHMEPVLIEAISYRQAHHSTSDDSFSYRPKEEVMYAQNEFDPVERINSFLLEQGIISEEELSSMSESERAAVLKALKQAETRPAAKLDTMFTDVLYERSSSSLRQERELLNHMAKYPENY